MNTELLLSLFERVTDAPHAISQLRQFIFDMAVRGKLVEQNIRDEPASELVKRIQKEKIRLVKAGEIKKTKPLPPVEEAAFDVPTGWEWVRIRQATSDRGQVTPNKDFTYIDVTAINKEAGRVANTKILSASNAPSRARKLVRTGDVLYSCVRPYLLNIAIIEEEISPDPIASTAFAVLNGFGLVLSKYLWIVLRSSFMVASVMAKMRGQAYPAISDTDFGLLPFPLPPLAEPYRITDKVNELMELCDQLERAQAEREKWRDHLLTTSLYPLTNFAEASDFCEHAQFLIQHLVPLTNHPKQIPALRQTVINLAVSGKLVAQDPNDEPANQLLDQINAERSRLAELDELTRTKPVAAVDPSEYPYQLPSTWKWVRVAEIADVRLGRQRSPEHHFGEFMRSYIRAANITWQGLDLSDVKQMNFPPNVVEAYLLRKNDILLNEASGSPSEVGKAVIWNEEILNCCFQNTLIRVRLHGVWPTYIRLHFENDARTGRFARIAQGLGINHLGADRLANMVIALPPLAEQYRIVAKTEELLALFDQLEMHLTTVQTESSRLFETLFDQPSGASIYEPSKQKFEEVQEGIESQNFLDTHPSNNQQLVLRHDLQFTKTNPVQTATQLAECVKALGGSILPEQLLNATGLGDSIEKFFSLLRESRNAGLLKVPEGAKQMVRSNDYED